MSPGSYLSFHMLSDSILLHYEAEPHLVDGLVLLGLNMNIESKFCRCGGRFFNTTCVENTDMIKVSLN